MTRSTKRAGEGVLWFGPIPVASAAVVDFGNQLYPGFPWFEAVALFGPILVAATEWVRYKRKSENLDLEIVDRTGERRRFDNYDELESWVVVSSDKGGIVES